MSRIACLLVPDLPVAAACRADPALAGRPLVLVEGSGPHAHVVAASRAARARGVQAGRHTVAQARALAGELVVHPRDAAAERSAAHALAEVAASLASRIETAADGAVFLDATGVMHLVASEAALATALVTRAARVGLEARAGVGAGMTVARLAAEHGDGTEVVPPGIEQGFLARLPLACLAPAADVATTLQRWGIHRLGELARLPVAEVVTRLGPAGAALVRAARGEDERPLAPEPLPTAVEEGVALEYALDNLEPLLFVLRGLVERAVARLGLAAIGCARVELALGLDDRGRDARALPLAAPTRDVKAILGCLRTELEGHPPRAAIVHVVLTAVPEAIRAMQMGLFVPPGPAPERLATTLARLSALCGPDRVGAPAVVDSHRPGTARTVPFALPPAEGPGRSPADTVCRLVVRALRPPRPVEVFTERGEPVFVRGEGLGGRVVGTAGPWRVVAEWWSEDGVARDYYDLELTDGGVYRCYRELGGAPPPAERGARSGSLGRWYLDGVYD
ncbi:MAG: DNA polymerase Y family protein [Deltaproteobacteria bacterium]|nr:MAG: DNA polymerase Y family protein [Deltaproteobacteria bacterium]